MVALCVYYGLLLAGLATMLRDGLGGVAFVTYYIGMPAGALGLWRYSGRRCAQLGFGWDTALFERALLGGAAAALIVVALFISLRAGGWIEAQSARLSVRDLLAGLLAQQIVVAALEELTFRGVLQPILADRWGVRRGLVIAALLFGAFHLPNIAYHDVPAHLVPLTTSTLALMGLVFGAAYERAERHLALPIALHAGWNVASFGLVDAFHRTYRGPVWLVGAPEWFPESGLMGAAGLVSLGVVVWLMSPPSARNRGMA